MGKEKMRWIFTLMLLLLIIPIANAETINVTIITPGSTNSSRNPYTIDFIVTAIDSATLNCSSYRNGTLVETNTSVVNDTITSLNTSIIDYVPEYIHNFSYYNLTIKCDDGLDNKSYDESYYGYGKCTVDSECYASKAQRKCKLPQGYCMVADLKSYTGRYVFHNDFSTVRWGLLKDYSLWRDSNLSTGFSGGTFGNDSYANISFPINKSYYVNSTDLLWIYAPTHFGSAGYNFTLGKSALYKNNTLQDNVIIRYRGTNSGTWGCQGSYWHYYNYDTDSFVSLFSYYKCFGSLIAGDNDYYELGLFMNESLPVAESSAQERMATGSTSMLTAVIILLLITGFIFRRGSSLIPWIVLLASLVLGLFFLLEVVL